eukprot:6086210-Amphidinium_carterae.3
MEASLSLQSAHLIHLEQQARGYYHSRWTSLEQEARLEYSRACRNNLPITRPHPWCCATHGNPHRARPGKKTASGAVLIP